MTLVQLPRGVSVALAYTVRVLLMSLPFALLGSLLLLLHDRELILNLKEVPHQ